MPISLLAAITFKKKLNYRVDLCRNFFFKWVRMLLYRCKYWRGSRAGANSFLSGYLAEKPYGGDMEDPKCTKQDFQHFSPAFSSLQPPSSFSLLRTFHNQTSHSLPSTHSNFIHQEGKPKSRIQESRFQNFNFPHNSFQTHCSFFFCLLLV